MKVFLTLMMLFMATAVQADQEDRVVIDIHKATERKYAVAVPPFLTGPGVDEAVARQAAQLLEWNLNFSGVFETVDTGPWLRQAEDDTIDAPNYTAWRMSGAVALVRARIDKRDDGGHTVEFRFHDPVQAKPLTLPSGALGKRYQVGADLAPAVHAFANVLMKSFNVEGGPFGTRVAFEYRKPKTTRKDLWVINLDGTGLQPLTQNNMLNLGPAWSRDGRYIAYTSYKRRNPDLFLMDLETGSDKPLSTRTGSNSGPSFSPDGKHVIASLSFEGNPNIYLLNFDGEIVKRLTNTASIDIQPSYSPDGKHIVFTSDRIGNPNIFIMDAEGRNVRRLTDTGRYNASPAWSPNGEWIAFASRDDGNIWVTRTDGSETRRVTNGEGFNEDPSWSPDGRYVVFSSNRKGTYDIWAADTISGTVTQITNLPGDERRPSWGPSYIQ